MMKKILLLSLIPVFYLSQNTKTDKVVNQVNSAIGTAGNIIGLFKKDKSATTSSTDNSVNKTSENKASGILGSILSGSTNNKNTITGGKITDKTKIIDCDDFGPFNHGAAIIRKGNAYALIDPSGNFLVPYNVYQSINKYSPSDSGFFNAVYNSQKEGHNDTVINYKGQDIRKLINDKDVEYIFIANDGSIGLCLRQNRSMNLIHTYYAVDLDGKKYPEFKLTYDDKVETDFISDSILVYSNYKTGKNIYSFIDLITGKTTKTNFDELSPFRDGLAMFSVTNQFGEKRYGFINKKGETVIPAQFSEKPDAIRDGIFHVRAASNADFLSALVDLDGNVIYKNTRESIKKYNYFMSFDELYSISGQYLLDRKGNIISKEQFAAAHGLTLGANSSLDGIDLKETNVRIRKKDGHFIFELNKKNGLGLASNKHCAILNYKTNKLIIFPQLDYPTIATEIDPYTNIARVSVLTNDKDINGKKIENEGYINEAGEFILLKGKPKSDF